MFLYDLKKQNHPKKVYYKGTTKIQLTHSTQVKQLNDQTFVLFGSH